MASAVNLTSEEQIELLLSMLDDIAENEKVVQARAARAEQLLAALKHELLTDTRTATDVDADECPF